jgi:hypothetical protein
MAGPENGKNGDRLCNKEYMKVLRRLQAELCKLQEWVKYTGISLRGQGSFGLTINCSPVISDTWELWYACRDLPYSSAPAGRCLKK